MTCLISINSIMVKYKDEVEFKGVRRNYCWILVWLFDKGTHEKKCEYV